MLLRSSPMKSGKGLVRDLCDTFVIQSGPVDDGIDADC